jgi:hypothetical protein
MSIGVAQFNESWNFSCAINYAEQNSKSKHYSANKSPHFPLGKSEEGESDHSKQKWTQDFSPREPTKTDLKDCLIFRRRHYLGPASASNVQVSLLRSVIAPYN